MVSKGAYYVAKRGNEEASYKWGCLHLATETCLRWEQGNSAAARPVPCNVICNVLVTFFATFHDTNGRKLVTLNYDELPDSGDLITIHYDVCRPERTHSSIAAICIYTQLELQ